MKGQPVAPRKETVLALVLWAVLIAALLVGIYGSFWAGGR